MSRTTNPSCDSQTIDRRILPVFRDGRDHEVLVTLGSDVARSPARRSSA
jgi:hypothetical protein